MTAFSEFADSSSANRSNVPEVARRAQKRGRKRSQAAPVYSGGCQDVLSEDARTAPTATGDVKDAGERYEVMPVRGTQAAVDDDNGEVGVPRSVHKCVSQHVWMDVDAVRLGEGSQDPGTDEPV